MHGHVGGYEAMRLDKDDADLDSEEDESFSYSTNGVSDSEDEIAALQAELRQVSEVLEEKKTELEHVTHFWAQRKVGLKANLDGLQNQGHCIKREIHTLRFKMMYGRYPPVGPEVLQFVDGAVFSSVICLVIFANLVVMTVEIMHPEDEDQFVICDYGFLVFYTIEIWLRWLYYRRHFLCGAWSVVGWHWLDLSLVLDGWLFILMMVVGAGRHTHSLQFLRFLRLLRYLRVLKLLNQVRRSNLSWVESDEFATFIISVIAVNSVVMGLEVEYPQLELVWCWLEHLFLLIFTLEIIVRLSNECCRRFFTDPDRIFFNYLDFFIVVGGIIDQWFFPLLTIFGKYLGFDTLSNVQLVHSFQMLRIIRLLRLLRLLRLIKNIPPLYTLIVGVLKAMQGMSWVMLLTVVVLYVSALVGVKLVGPRGLLVLPKDDSGEAPDNSGNLTILTQASARFLHGHGGGGGGAVDEGMDVQSCFPNIFDATFNLFKVMQMDFEPMEPLFAWAPVSRYIIMLYVVITNWAIFSILTAVVSDEMAKVTQTLELEQQALEIGNQNKKVVAKIFDRLDTDHSGEITERDYKDMLTNREAIDEICEAASLEKEDLQDLFDILCHEKADGEELLISQLDFIEGLEREREVVNNRAMLKLDKRLDDVDHKLVRGMRRLEALIQKVVVSTPNGVGLVTPSGGIASPASSAFMMSSRNDVR